MTKKSASESAGSAGRIAPGDIITSRELATIQSERILLPAPGMLTHLQFRRYAGCPSATFTCTRWPAATMKSSPRVSRRS